MHRTAHIPEVDTSIAHGHVNIVRIRPRLLFQLAEKLLPNGGIGEAHFELWDVR